MVLALCKNSSTLWLLCHLSDVHGELLDIIAAIRKNVDLQSEQSQDQTIQTSNIPFLTATISGYLLRGFLEPDVCCLEEPSVDFLLLSCPVVAWTHARFKQLQHPVQGISQLNSLVWRTICCCFEPAVCCFYLIPAHSCSRRESKHIITCSLSLCQLWIYTALSDSTLHSYSS